MLQNIRDKLQGQRWLAYGLLGTLALVFAAWGAYGIVDLSLGPSKYAAKVNGQEIPITEVQRVWQDQQPQYLRLFGGDIPTDRRVQLQNDLLDAFVRNTALEQHASKAGLRVSDAQIRKAYEDEPAFQIDGKFSREAARARLAQVGISAAAFEADRRRALGVSQLERAVAASEFLTPAEIARLLALENEQREVRFALLSPQAYAGKAPVAEQDVAAYYEAHEADFQTTETVKLAYAELNLEDIAAQVLADDAELQARYEKAKDRYVDPERRRARHILIEAADPKQDAAARKKADDLLAQINAGGDFAALAKQHSQDAGSAAQGGDLGFQDKSLLVGPFADAVFSMSAGEVRGPVKTEFGYHLIKLEEIRSGKARSFAEARAELEADYRRELAAEQFGDQQEKIQQRIERAGVDFAQLAEEFHLRAGEVDKFARGAGAPPFGSNPDLNQLVFSEPVLVQHNIGGPVALSEDRLLFVKVLEHYKPTLKPLSEVHDSIVVELNRQRGSQVARKAAEQAEQTLAAGAGDDSSFDKVASSLGARAEPARYVSRGDPQLLVQVRDFAFSVPKPAGKPIYKALALDDGSVALVAVTSSRQAPDDGNRELMQQRVQQELSRQGAADMQAYVSELVRTAKVRKNLQAFE